MKRVIVWLILSIFFLSLTWALFIPLWHTPDEQAHFGHVAYIAEGGKLPMPRRDDQSEEIITAERFLGTFRDENGNNRFTFHPEYRLDYTSNLIGKYETDIKSISLLARSNLVAVESAYYPHFYYQISSQVYKLFYQFDLFVRTFGVRIFWLFIYILMIYFSYQIGLLVFKNNQFLGLSVALLTGFQPMLTFVSVGVTNDGLHNLLFTALIYFCLKLNQKIRLFDLAGLGLTLVIGFANKPQFWVSLGIVVPVLFWRLYHNKQKKLLLILSLLGSVLLLLVTKGKIPYFEVRPVIARPDYTLWQHLIYTAQHTFREVLPWYWGVFRWLSLTLPRWVNQVMMRILLVAGIGLGIKLWRRKFEPGFWIIVWSAVIYFLALFFWDFQQVRSAGFPFGLQGRYYFPTIVPHMVLLIIGLKQIWSKLIIILDFWFICLNWIAFYWVTASYYSTANFSSYIIQASQYKPFFAKGWWLVIILFLALLTNLIFSIKLFKLYRHEK